MRNCSHSRKTTNIVPNMSSFSHFTSRTNPHTDLKKIPNQNSQRPLVMTDTLVTPKFVCILP